MRYIGNKENIIEKIDHILQSKGIVGKSFFDFFSGTTNVAKFYKEKGYTIYSSDVLYMSYCLQKAYIENNTIPTFDRLLPHLQVSTTNQLFTTPLENVIHYLNSLPPLPGFIFRNYTPEGTKDLPQPRMYFSNDNGQKIDAIRQQIEVWNNAKLLSESEYFILISCLIETISFYANVAGVYAAFHKKWDPRAIKPLVLRPIKLIDNNKSNMVFYGDSMSLLPNIDVDILYLDPPYNERQYLPNYHLVETIALYDNPSIHGVTGMRNYENKKSSFCNAHTALRDLETIAQKAKYKYLVLSYNSEGIMTQDDIIKVLSKYGDVELEQFQYARFKSNNNGLSQTKKHVFEQLYILKKKPMVQKNLWILTEERPKREVLQTIFEYFAKDYNCGFFGDNIRIIPILDEKKCFNFTYEIIGFKCSKVNRIFLKTVSEASSFTDFLVFYQEEQPTITDTPIYAIEETKTDDKESRNTGVYQRCSKFVFIQSYYPTTKKIMLYALQIKQKEQPTETYIFGTRLLMTLGVEILGKILDYDIFKPFSSITELIEYKNQMRKPPIGNAPIIIEKNNSKIQISGRLYKDGRLAHDPNIGALSIISAVLRKLGWTKDIEITQHGLSQQHIGKRNKFVLIANQLNLQLHGMNIPKVDLPKAYWRYEKQGEKLGTIFIHIAVENFTEGYSIFENHAGCEKSYFQTSSGEVIPLAKYTNRDAYKAGDKTQIISIPDLVLIDIAESEAITIEGKKFEFRHNGIEELGNYEAFDQMYLKKYYTDYKVIRTVVLYGSQEESIIEIQVGFLLNKNGKLILGVNAPKLFRRAIKNLLNYWN